MGIAVQTDVEMVKRSNMCEKTQWELDWERKWIRADGRTVCDICGLPYARHKMDKDSPFLHQICSGLLVKT